VKGAARPVGRFARWLIAWAERYSDPADREWIGAMRAELDVIDGSLAQLRWAAGVIPLLWRSYRADVVGFVLCTAVVVLANYAYPKFATSRPVELFFFAQQFYLPVIGIIVARATRRVLAGTLMGIALSLLGFGLLHVLGYGSPNTTALLANGSPSIYVEILSFALVGAALGTLGAGVVVRGSRGGLLADRGRAR
jgi:hypothetical protein